MLKAIVVATAFGLLPFSAYAADNFSNATLATSLSKDWMTVTDWYMQSVYDPNDNKIGEIMDVLFDKCGKSLR
jgi:hypothetical protein